MAFVAGIINAEATKGKKDKMHSHTFYSYRLLITAYCLSFSDTVILSSASKVVIYDEGIIPVNAVTILVIRGEGSASR